MQIELFKASQQWGSPLIFWRSNNLKRIFILHIRCETYFVDEDGNKVSGEYRFIANSTSDDAMTRVTKIRFTLKNMEFDRNKRYYLILRNMENASEYIEREQFIIDILGFKPF